MRFPLRAVVLGATLLVATSCGARHSTESQSKQSPQTIRTASVRTIEFATVRELSGTIAASRQAAVGSVAAGRVVAIYVRTGDTVTAGEPIARIDDAEYRAGYAQARGSANAASATVARARAEAESARARLHLAEVTAGRMSVLYRQGAISAQQNDEAQADLASARAALTQARAEIGAAAGSQGAADAAVAAASVPLDEALIRAPFDGVVLSRAVDPGAVVGAGSPIATIEDNHSLELDVAVPEEAVSALHDRMPVRVRLDAIGKRTISGRVRAIVPSNDPLLRSATVKIELAQTNGLLAGMFARVSLQGPKHRAAAVPVAALVERAGQQGVFAVNDSRAVFIPVQTGMTQNGWLELENLRNDIHEVAVDGVAGLDDGKAVAIAR